MSNNSDTISKLSDALSNLINAYETLQKEKEDLEKEKQRLENKIEDLEASNGDLTSKLNEINSTNEKQGSNINSMLHKIENILKVGDRKKDNENNNNSNNTYEKSLSIDDEEFSSTPTISSDAFSRQKAESVSVDDIQLEKKSDDKIDLNRMASLLNGFNK